MRALGLLQAIITRAAGRCSGYVVEATHSLVLCAFGTPGAALTWALTSRLELARHEWDPQVGGGGAAAAAACTPHGATCCVSPHFQLCCFATVVGWQLEAGACGLASA